MAFVGGKNLPYLEQYTQGCMDRVTLGEPFRRAASTYLHSALSQGESILRVLYLPQTHA